MNLKLMRLAGQVLKSKPRINTYLAISQGKLPVQIAEELGLSRAAIQKHLDLLIAAGLLRRDGSGRRTKFLCTEISNHFFVEISVLADLMQKQQELIQLEDTLATLDQLNKHKVETPQGKAFRADIEKSHAALYQELAPYKQPPPEVEDE